MSIVRYTPLICILYALCTFLAASVLGAQDAASSQSVPTPTPAPAPQPAPQQDDYAALVGKTLPDLLSQYGSPYKAYAVRGKEVWQDDVVLAFRDFDCYVYEDRVWQVRVDAAYGVKAGDSRAAVKEVLGAKVVSNYQPYEFDSCILLRLPSGSWEMTLRVNFDDADKADALFIYRSDL